jgi:hypothetical protein
VVAGIDKAYRRFGIGRSAVRLLSYSAFEGRPLTTRGRWINPIVLALSAVLTKTAQLKDVSRPVFIVGTGRSGTTILGITLSLHARVAYLNEPKALWHRAFPGEDIIGNYSPEPGRYILTEQDASVEVADRFRKLYGAYLRLSRRTRVVDKYPEALFRIPFLLRVFPDARFIWLVRNGYDTVASIEKWSREHQSDANAAQENWWGLNDRKWHALVNQVCSQDPRFEDSLAELLSLHRDSDKAAVEWMASVHCGLREEAARPDKILRVHFEALSQQVETSIGKILKFCDLEEDPAVFEFARLKLAPVAAYEMPALAPAIQTSFAEAMQSLGYVTNGTSNE